MQSITTLSGIQARSDRNGSRLYVDPTLPDWLPGLILTDLQVGCGSVTLDIGKRGVVVRANSSGFKVVRGPWPR